MNLLGDLVGLIVRCPHCGLSANYEVDNYQRDRQCPECDDFLRLPAIARYDEQETG